MIVSDTTCLIAFEKAGFIGILPSLFGTVLIPLAVAQEYGALSLIPDWMETVNLMRLTVGVGSKHPETLRLDGGEAEAITLALDYGKRLIIDERKGRAVAQHLGVEVAGSLAVLGLAYDEGLISSLATAIEALRATGFRAHDAVVAAVLAGRH